MKWTPIDKAKPKFKQMYLIANKTGMMLGWLDKTQQTEKGLTHTFGDGIGQIEDATHIAIVDNPNGPS